MKANTNQHIPNLISIEFTLDIQPTIPLSTPIPDHFYGCLASTSEGCRILEENGNLESYNDTILSNNSTLLQKKESLWALGHIYTTKGGCELLNRKLFTYDEYDITHTPIPSFFPLLVELAEGSVNPSLRGTAFFIMGLMAGNEDTNAEIENYDWSILKYSPIPIALPKTIDNLLALNNETELGDEFRFSSRSNGSEEEFDDETPSNDKFIEIEAEPIHLGDTPEERKQISELMRFISGLCNTLSFKKCAVSLSKMKKDNPKLFSDKSILYILL